MRNLFEFHKKYKKVAITKRVPDFEVEIKVLGEFPTYVKPQITQNIKVINEKLNTEDPSLSETVLSITTEAESDFDAEYFARKILIQFLSFYSATTLNHIRIIDDYNDPIKIKNLTGEREISLYPPTAYSLTEFDSQFFLSKIFPYYSVMTKKGNEYLKIATEYIWRGAFEESAEISIIDCFISLEALCMRTNDNTELSYRISNRLAVLLGEDDKSRLNLRKAIRDFYNIRSRIVHGEYINLPREGHNSLFVWTRKAILRFFVLAEKYQNHDEIIDLIDDAMIDNKILEKLNEESCKLIDVIEEEYEKFLSHSNFPKS